MSDGGVGGRGIEMVQPAVERRPVSGEGGGVSGYAEMGVGSGSGGRMRSASGSVDGGQRYADWESQNPKRSNSGTGRLRKRFAGLDVGGS